MICIYICAFLYVYACVCVCSNLYFHTSFCFLLCANVYKLNIIILLHLNFSWCTNLAKPHSQHFCFTLNTLPNLKTLPFDRLLTCQYVIFRLPHLCHLLNRYTANVSNAIISKHFCSCFFVFSFT